METNQPPTKSVGGAPRHQELVGSGVGSFARKVLDLHTTFIAKLLKL
jgi:hypothetical protein